MPTGDVRAGASRHEFPTRAASAATASWLSTLMRGCGTSASQDASLGVFVNLSWSFCILADACQLRRAASSFETRRSVKPCFTWSSTMRGKRGARRTDAAAALFGSRTTQPGAELSSVFQTPDPRFDGCLRYLCAVRFFCAKSKTIPKQLLKINKRPSQNAANSLQGYQK